MMKAVLLAAAAIIGAALSVLVFLVIDFPIQLPFTIDELGVRTAHGFLIASVVGAVGGGVMGRAAQVWTNKPQMRVPEPSALPPANAPVQPRRHCRPLIWINRA